MTQPHMTQFDLSRWIVENEFASVAISVDEEGNSTRLRIEDLRTGTSRLFDALELESLVHLSEDRLAVLLDPSADRWRHDS
jgi:hypothetical protein